MRSYKRFTLALAALSVITLSPGLATAQRPAARKAAAHTYDGKSTPGLRRRTFEAVWRTVNEKHFDPKFNGVDWGRVRELYAPRVARVKSDKEFYGLLQQMLGELHQSHFVILPPEITYKPEKKQEGQEARTGMGLRVIEGEPVIWRVLPESGAAHAGLRPGFVIKEVDGQTVEQIGAPAKRRATTPEDFRGRLLDELEEKLLGAPGSTVRVVYMDGADRRHEVSIRRELLKGEMSPPFGSFPSLFTEFESKRLAGGIGYLRFSMFHPFFNQRIRAAVRSMSDAPGLVIDLRGNPGGFDGVGKGLAALLLEKQTLLGVSRSRDSHENYVVYPLKDPYKGPVVILVDSLSGSASESFAGGMQSVGRAVVVGERSGGDDLDASIVKLPTGALLLYAYADFVTAKGVSLEGRGVVPDIEVNLTRASLLAGDDPQLEAAVKYINSSQKSVVSSQ